jgi:hypothetical protein
LVTGKPGKPKDNLVTGKPGKPKVNLVTGKPGKPKDNLVTSKPGKPKDNLVTGKPGKPKDNILYIFIFYILFIVATHMSSVLYNVHLSMARSAETCCEMGRKLHAREYMVAVEAK